MKASDTTMLTFIATEAKQFIIPPFQRNYEWTFNECDDLFDDIIEITKTKAKHYLGNIVYYISEDFCSTNQRYILIDGQQRMTSILLLLCAIRDLLDDKNLDEHNTKDYIDKQYLTNSSSEENFKIKLKQTSYDNEKFELVIRKNATKSDNSNIIKNYFHFKERLQNAEIKIIDIYRAIKNIEIVDVNLQIDSDLRAVQIIFEKINSTGKPLSAADLIRNYLLISNNIKEQEYLYKSYWTLIENNVKSEYISDFVKDYLMMKSFKDVSSKATYKMFKNYVESENLKHEDVLCDMLNYSAYYAHILFEDCKNENLNRLLKMLKALKVNGASPLYLFLIKELYENNDILLVKIFKLLKDFLLRYRIVSPSKGGASLQEMILKLIKNFTEKTLDLNYDTILFELSNSYGLASRFPNDNEFKEALKKL